MRNMPSVLVVDDEIRIVHALVRVLGAAGYDVAIATDGRQAVEAIMSRNFDVIVSDINMPGMSGISLLRSVRAHDLDVIDGVYNDIDDLDGLREECLQGRDLGMDGKTLIHPKQIAIANEVFSPTPAEIDWATRILAAFALPENSSKGVITVDGRMVERLHAEMAERTMAIANAMAASSAAA